MADKSHSLETDWARAPPPSGPAWRTFANALYNPEENSFLGRTPKRWGIMLVFYSVFYAVLALLFAACMGGLFITLDPKTPTHILDKSLIGSNPGVASRPRPLYDMLVVSYNLTVYDDYVKQLKEFFAPYRTKETECTAQDSYGFPQTPCFFIKLNKIIGWKPDCYDDAANLPADMPQDLKDYIASLEPAKLKQIWVSCWEEKANTTKIEYPSGRGLPASYYPYVNEENYLSPVVAVRLTPPVDKLVTIRCRFWAKNLRYNKSLKEPSGYTRFQLTVGNTTKQPSQN